MTGIDLNSEGIKFAIDRWLAKEKEAEEKGMWVNYRFCHSCCGLYASSSHTDGALARQVGELAALTNYLDRQRVACSYVVFCTECDVAIARTGKMPKQILSIEEARDFAVNFINKSGLKGIL